MRTTEPTARAEHVMARQGKTFYRAAALLPAAVRAQVIALYAFCRNVDDLADEPGKTRALREEALSALIAAFDRHDDAALHAAGWPFAAEGPIAAAGCLLTQAARSDLNQQQPHSQAELLTYAFGVAGTVGIMLFFVLRARQAGARAAVSLGMAMQLSNIARDIAEDFANGRVYLPADLVSGEALGLALDTLETSASRKVIAATAQVLALAERLYEAAFDGIGTLPWRTRWSILAAALCYREIGREVGRRGERAWRERVVISTGRKLWLIGVAGLRLLQPRFFRARPLRSVDVLGSGVLADLHRLGLN